MQNWLSSLIHYLFVATCDFCNRELSGRDFNRICLRCVARLENTRQAKICEWCFHPLNPISNQLNTQPCQVCLKKEDFLNVNRSLFFNQELAKKLIYDFKFQPHSSYSSIIVYWTLKKYKQFLDSFDVFLPIPLGKKGLYEREFCQVTKVTRILSRMVKKPMVKAILRNEKKYLGAQHQLGAQERKLAVEEKYLYLPKFKDVFSGKNVLVIDDIFTTGSTLKNAAKLIVQNNENVNISSFTFLRTVLDS